MKKIIVIGILLLAAAFCAWWFLIRERPFNATYAFATVERTTLTQSITATGTLEAVTKVDVGTQVSGIVSHLYVDYNSTVKKGQVIAELDRTNLLSELSSKKSALAASKSEYDYQSKNYERQKTLHEKMMISDADFENAEYTYMRAKSSYEVSKNDVAKAQTNLGYATITSPIDGIVISKDVEEGQTVASSFSTPTLFVIAQDLRDMQVIANVDEADIGGVKEGQRVSFSVDAYPEETFNGEVRQVRQEATTTSNVVTYEVVISAPNPELKLKPGLTANVTIFTVEKDSVLAIGSKALRFDPTSAGMVGKNDTVIDCTAKHKLWQRDGHVFRARAVEVGMTSGTKTEITDGVKEGEQFVLQMTTGEMPGANNADKHDNEKKETSPFMPQRGKRGGGPR